MKGLMGVKGCGGKEIGSVCMRCDRRCMKVGWEGGKMMK